MLGLGNATRGSTDKERPPSERTRETLRRLLSAGGVGEDPKSLFVRLGVEATIEEGLEAKGRDLLRREHYARGAGQGYRNGYRGRRWPRQDRFLHESMETARRSIRHPTQPDTPEAFSVKLRRHHNQGLVSQVPAAWQMRHAIPLPVAAT